MSQGNSDNEIGNRRSMFTDAIAHLNRGDVSSAVHVLGQNISATLKQALPPDPVEWAYFALSLICGGNLADAGKYLAKFKDILHPELIRVRWLMECLSAGKRLPPGDAENPPAGKSIHDLPAMTLEQWLGRVCGMMRICGQNVFADVFSGSQPAAPPPQSQPTQSPTPPAERKKSGLDVIIPPEVKNDEFYELIRQFAGVLDIKTILEIGSSSGGGSTEAFVKGIMASQARDKRLFCMEVSQARFDVLKNAYRQQPFVRCYNVSSVPINSFMTPQQVEHFYRNIPTALNAYPLEQVQGWLVQDIDYIRQAAVPEDGIEIIKRENGISTFDMVLIDGSAFTGEAELARVYGSRLILLDDTNDIKNQINYRRLLADPNYQLVCENQRLRNGYAVFKLIGSPPPTGQRKILYSLGVGQLKPWLEGKSGPRFREYATHHGFEYRQITDYDDIGRQPTWIKIHYARKLMDELRDGDKIAFVDADVAVVRGDMPLATSKSVAFAMDSAGVINAGVWAATVNDFSREFFRRVWEHAECADDIWQDNRAILKVLDELSESQRQAHIEILPNCMNVTIIQGESPEHDKYLKNPCAEPIRLRHFAGGQKYLNKYFEAPIDFTSPASSPAAAKPQTVAASAASPSSAADADPLPVQFFTIVLNGMPFIKYHSAVLKKLPFRWKWHIVEGVAELKHDTGWSVQNGGKVDPSLHRDGRSNDGTSEYIDELAREFPDNVIVYRQPPGKFWEGKCQMVNAPLANINEQCLLWEIDVDELWTSQQLIDGRRMFLDNPDKSAALYWCQFFVGPELVISNRRCYGNHGGGEWMRTWRYSPGDQWATHEPPQLCRRASDGKLYNVAAVNPFMQDETEKAGLVFQHFAYALAQQLRFKEIYYGYRGAVEMWNKLQSLPGYPVALRDFFPWVRDDSRVDLIQHLGIKPFLRGAPGGGWMFVSPDHPAAPQDDVRVVSKIELPSPKSILWIRVDAIGDNILASSMLEHIRRRFPKSRLTVLCQDRVAELYENCPHIDATITIERQKSLFDPDYVNQFIAKLKTMKFDMTINSTYSREPYTDAISVGCGAKTSIAIDGDSDQMTEQMRQAGNKQFTHIIPTGTQWMTELERHRRFLGGLGIDAPELSPIVWTRPEDEQWAENTLAGYRVEPGKYFAFFGGAGHFQKLYLRFGEAIDHTSLAQQKTIIFSMGGAGDLPINTACLSNANYSGSNKAYVDMTGKTTIRQAAALLRRCPLVIGVDTSLAHVACAVGTPHVIVLYGGRFGRFLPYSPKTSVVCLPLSCYRCLGRCPYARAYCCRDIAPEVVAKAITQTMTKRSELPRIFAQSEDFWHAPLGQPKWAPMENFLEGVKCQVINVTPESLTKG